MDFKSPRYFQSHTNSSSTFSSLVNGEPPLELERLETFPDPLCKLNLKETSEFVKSLPRRSEGIINSGASSAAAQKRLVVAAAEPAPLTPGRPVLGFSPSGSYPGNNRKSFPSKWDDAEKWVVSSSSCHHSPPHHSLRPSNNINNFNVFKQQMEAFSGKSSVIVDEEKVSSKAVPNFQPHNSSVRGFNAVFASADHLLLLKDKFTNETPQQNSSVISSSLEPTKETFLFKNEAAMRDAGTEMTPLGSACHTPAKPASPARHNTPLDRSGPLGQPPCSAHLDDIAGLAKLQYWSSREEEEEEVSKSLRHFDIIDNGCHNKAFIANINNNNVVNSGNESRAARWEEEEKAKCCSRYQREEAKIQAWVNLQSAKAEAHSRKLEVKIQKMRSNLEEKLMKRMSVVHRKAEERRESARKQHSDQMQKATQHSHKMLNCNDINYHSHFSTYTTTSCGCFPCQQ